MTERHRKKAIPLRLLPLLVLFPVGCLVDLDQRCGPDQRYDPESHRCACDDGHALVGNRCLACGEHELATPDGCRCEPGYLRASDDEPCEENDTLGKACASDDDCPDPTYGYCAPDAASPGGYCTASGCSASTGCEGDYACNGLGDPSFCERPPSGVGHACNSDDDCADFEASFCETVVAHQCLVHDCKPDPTRCYGDWVCCDIGLIGQSLCMPPTELEGGNCPAGGTLISKEAP
jgi:hypothetical protein